MPVYHGISVSAVWKAALPQGLLPQHPGGSVDAFIKHNRRPIGQRCHLINDEAQACVVVMSPQLRVVRSEDAVDVLRYARWESS